MRALIIISALLLSACAATRIDYQPNPTLSNPAAIVERVLYEQPDSKRPESVNVTDTYVEYGTGLKTVSTPSGMGSTTSTSLLKGVRIYYRSVAETRLYRKNRWYVVEPRSAAGRTLAQVYVEDESTAKRLMDALATLKDKAPPTE